VSGAAGELGHVLVADANGRNSRCSCGHINCLELFSTVPMIQMAVDRKYRQKAEQTGEKAPAQITHLWMKKAYEAGDPCVREAVEEAAHALGKEIANLANILNPQMIVFGGGTISAFPDIVRIVEEDLRKYSLDIISADISVEISQLGTEGAVIGAALLAINDLIR